MNNDHSCAEVGRLGGRGLVGGVEGLPKLATAAVRTRRGVGRRVFRVRSLPDTKTNAFLAWEGDRITSDSIPATQYHYIIDYIKVYKIPRNSL